MPAHPTFWKVKAMLMHQARPAVRAQICAPPSQILSVSIGKPTPVGLADIFCKHIQELKDSGQIWECLA
jgi:hypothetical protein